MNSEEVKSRRILPTNSIRAGSRIAKTIGTFVRDPERKLPSGKKLSPEQYNICFLKGTEPPFSGKFTNNKAAGMYVCVVCGSKLFESDTKYDSKTGWPSFWNTVAKDNVKLEDDYSLGTHRTEVLCKKCGSHLGHVFNDGPEPTGLRYCINSLALEFIPKE